MEYFIGTPVVASRKIGHSLCWFRAAEREHIYMIIAALHRREVLKERHSFHPELQRPITAAAVSIRSYIESKSQHE